MTQRVPVAVVEPAAALRREIELPWRSGRAREAFKAAIAAALLQLAVLRAAESRLLIAATAAAQSTDPLPVYIP